MKHTLITADRIPAPSLVETARREAIETARREAIENTEGETRRINQLMETVRERSETARRLEEKYKSLEAYAQSFETSPAYNEETAADLKKETRRALDLAREARAAECEAVEEYRAAVATREALISSYDMMINCPRVVVSVRYKTAADIVAAEKKTAAARLERLIDEGEKVDPADLKIARAAARAAAKAAEEEAKNAPRIFFTIGSPVDDRRPYISLNVAHTIADRVIETLHGETAAAVVARIGTYFNVAFDPDSLMLPAARAYAKRTAANAVQRQGTPAQIIIDRYARAGLWEDCPDLEDMTAAALETLALSTAPAAALKKEARTLEVMREARRRILEAGENDRIAAARILAAAAEASGNDPRICSDIKRLKARAEALALSLEAAADLRAADDLETLAAALEKLTRSAYYNINVYLGDIRKVGESATRPTAALEDLEEILTGETSPREDESEYKAMRRENVAAAAARMSEALTPAQYNTLKALYASVGNTAAAARRTRRTRRTVRGHMLSIKRVFVAALNEIAPEAIETRGINLMCYIDEVNDLRAAAARFAKIERERKSEAAARRVCEYTAVAEIIAAAVEELPPAMKQTVALIKNGASKREAARVLNKNEKTVREAAAAAARKIATALEASTIGRTIDPALIAAADLETLLRLI